ncbi:solute carrier family 22 member 7-like [Amblyomma americanum]|uniref:Organic cation/carnitine transporter n=1 Tax=Amblyomma americanum TaxID=6943 RepID=A0AAQ4EJB3_AMBAM
MAEKKQEAPEMSNTGWTRPVGSLLTSFACSDTRTTIQESMYCALGHGGFQRRVLCTGVLSVVVLLVHTFAYILIGRDIDHWCRPPDNLRHIPTHVWKNVAIPIEADGSVSRCTIYDPPLPLPEHAEEDRHAIRCHRWDYDIRDVSDSIVSRWNLVCGNRWMFEMSKANMLAAMLLVPAAGYAADLVGRQPVIIASAVALLACSVIASVAQTFSVFTVARFLVSAASCSVQVLIFILIYEVTASHKRAMYGVLDTAIGTTLVPPVLDGVALLQPRWHLSQAFLLLPSAALLFWCYLLDESPSWLFATRKFRAAEKVVLYAAQSNGVDLYKAQETLHLLKTQILKHDAAVHSPGSVMASESCIQHPAFRRKAVSVIISWFSVNLAYYGLVLRHSPNQTIWSVVQVVFQTLLYAGVCWFIGSHGQRETLSLLLGMLCVMAVVHACSSLVDVARLSAAVGVAVMSFASTALSLNYGYTAEVFPTVIRSIGLTVSYMFGRLAVLTAAFIVEFSGTPRDADVVLDFATAFLALLSALAIQWLPEIFAGKRPKKARALTEEERKAEILASLMPPASPRSGFQSSRRSSRRSRSKSASVSSASSGRSLSRSRTLVPKFADLEERSDAPAPHSGQW